MSNKRTPLYPVYEAYPGVKIADFHGWDLPIQFADGIIAEHQAVRTAAGLFDVSHMGEFLIQGAQAESFIDQLVTNNIVSMKPGTVRYTLMCYPDGGVVDDLIVYRISEIQFLLVVNAGNRKKDFTWITRENPLAQGETPLPEIRDQSDQWALLALQGPQAQEMLTQLVPEAADISFFQFRDDLAYGDAPLLISRTGYTGEDGFELYMNSEDAPELWSRLISLGVMPCGLGARDTLRLEAKLPLYGHELSDSVTPLEANLAVFADLEKPYFVGKEALVHQKETGIPRSLRGLEMIDSGVPREGYEVYHQGACIGHITSGTKSPTLQKFIALALIERGRGLKIGDEIEVLIRSKRKKARLVKTPFYKKTGRS